MAASLESFCKLLDWIDRMVSVRGNEPLRAELQRRYDNSCDNPQTPYDDIYELCVEKIISSQAHAFYHDFPIREIRDQLIADFIKMEHFKRRDNFDEYCMALYQQIEAVVTTLSSEAYRLDGYVRNRLAHRAFPKSPQNNQSIAEFLYGTKYMQSVSSTPLHSMQARSKSYSILFFVCFEGILENQSYDEYKILKRDIQDIYAMRNRNHRGVGGRSDEEDKKYELLVSQKPILYFQYAWTLSLFMRKITEAYPKIETWQKETLQNPSPVIAPSGPKIVGHIDLDKFNYKRK